MVDTPIKPRKVSLSLYLAALLISAVIFSLGIFVGKAIEQDNLESISYSLDSANIKASSLELLYLAGDSPEFCPVYSDELAKIDAQTEQAGYKLSYLEEKKGITDPELKKKYFMLEASAFLLSEKVKEKCGASYTTILYFYSNTNCSQCYEQGIELLELKRKMGEGVRIYSFDGDLGSPIVDAFKSKYGISAYPGLVIRGNSTLSGLRTETQLSSLLEQG